MAEKRTVVKLLAASRTLTQTISDDVLLDAEENFAESSGLALGLEAQDILIVFACLEGSIEILFQISQAEQERQRNIAAKSIFERALDHLILLRLIKIKMLAVGEHELSFRFVVTPEHSCRDA